MKNVPTCFCLISIVRERTIWALLKLLLLKQSESSVKIHRFGQFSCVAAYTGSVKIMLTQMDSNRMAHRRILPLLFVLISITHFKVDG